MERHGRVSSVTSTSHRSYNTAQNCASTPFPSSMPPVLSLVNLLNHILQRWQLQILSRPSRRLLPTRQVCRVSSSLRLQAPSSRRGIRSLHQCRHRSRSVCGAGELESGIIAEAKVCRKSFNVENGFDLDFRPGNEGVKVVSLDLQPMVHLYAFVDRHQS